MLATGKQVSGLEILAHIGAGGFADVYRVRRTSDGAELALKWFRDETPYPELLERFRREAQVQRSLRHPHIVAVHELIESDEGTGMVMELYPSGSLADLLAGRPADEPMTPERLRALFVPLLRGLHHAHEQGIIHRDIKPENILLRTDGSGLLVGALSDFGIAQVRGEPRLTLDGQKMGTLGYMSPEQQRNPRDIDHRSDLYSMGVVLFECATCALPEVDPGAFDRLWERDPALAEVLRAALQPLPAMRFSTCAELATALESPRSDLTHRVQALEARLAALPPAPPVPSPAPPAVLPPPLLAIELVAVPLGGALMAAGSAPRLVTVALMATGALLIAATARRMWRGAPPASLWDLLPVLAGGVASGVVLAAVWPADGALGAALVWGLVPTILAVARIAVGARQAPEPEPEPQRKTSLDVGVWG